MQRSIYIFPNFDEKIPNMIEEISQIGQIVFMNIAKI